jgi:very-short-patch-repair endonuclease
MVDRARLHLVHRGVYAVGHPGLTRKGRWMAAVLAAGPGAVLSHRSAGALWTIVSGDGRVVAVSRTAACGRRPGIQIHRVQLEADEVTTVDGIPVTTVARTLLDLAGELPRGRLERALDEAEVRRLGDATPLRELIDRYPRRRGTRTLREIRADHVGAVMTRHELERRFVIFLDDHDLPRPLVNHQIPDIGECDIVWPGARLVVELDGYETHGTRRSFESDRARDRALQVAGWRVVRITWRQLRDDPRQVAADLRVLLSAPG